MLAAVVDIREVESSRELVSRQGNAKNQAKSFVKKMNEKSKTSKRIKLNKSVSEIKAKNEMMRPNKHQYYIYESHQ